MLETINGENAISDLFVPSFSSKKFPNTCKQQSFSTLFDQPRHLYRSGAFSGFRSYLCEDDHALQNNNISLQLSGVIRVVQNFGGLLQKIENCGHWPADYIRGLKKRFDGTIIEISRTDVRVGD